MGIIQFIAIAVVLGIIVWLVQTYAPIPQQIKNIILIAVIICLVLILLAAMGLLGGDVQIPRVR